MLRCFIDPLFQKSRSFSLLPKDIGLGKRGHLSIIVIDGDQVYLLLQTLSSQYSTQQ